MSECMFFFCTHIHAILSKRMVYSISSWLHVDRQRYMIWGYLHGNGHLFEVLRGWIATLRVLHKYMYILHQPCHREQFTTWLRLEICTTCNAWDKYKSRVPSVMLGISISLTYTAQCSYSILPSLCGTSISHGDIRWIPPLIASIIIAVLSQWISWLNN